MKIILLISTLFMTPIYALYKVGDYTDYIKRDVEGKREVYSVIVGDVQSRFNNIKFNIIKKNLDYQNVLEYVEWYKLNELTSEDQIEFVLENCETASTRINGQWELIKHNGFPYPVCRFQVTNENRHYINYKAVFSHERYMPVLWVGFGPVTGIFKAVFNGGTNPKGYILNKFNRK